ncbi:hypothetical protein [Candidatus Thiodubiliella endoseptemdiera]|uniref:hypothetical protein n=1 Tax=Candidatus Thiodubiliella endoseptemdiera TaxID=2738886 RepID=UPI0034DF334A
MNTINTLSRFVISAFLLLLTTQAFATLNPNPATKEYHVITNFVNTPFVTTDSRGSTC